jgi:hypothetical protein
VAILTASVANMFGGRGQTLEYTDLLPFPPDGNKYLSEEESELFLDRFFNKGGAIHESPVQQIHESPVQGMSDGR